jgi:hypothetical protein
MFLIAMFVICDKISLLFMPYVFLVVDIDDALKVEWRRYVFT